MDLSGMSVAQQEQEVLNCCFTECSDEREIQIEETDTKCFIFDEIVVEEPVLDNDDWPISDISETNHGDSHVISRDEGEKTSNESTNGNKYGLISRDEGEKTSSKKNNGNKSGVISRDEGEKASRKKNNRNKSGNIVLRRSERIKKIEAEKKMEDSKKNTVPVTTKKDRKNGKKENKNSDKIGKKSSQTSGSKTSRKFRRETLNTESEPQSPPCTRITITKQHGVMSKINLEMRNVKNVPQGLLASMLDEIVYSCHNKLQRLNYNSAQTTVDDVTLNMPHIDIKQQRRNVKDFISRQKSCLQEENFIKDNDLADKILDVKMSL